MTGHGWRRAAPPDLRHRPAEAWGWEISRAAQLTQARRELAVRLDAGSLPDGAEPQDVDRLLLMFEELASNGLRHGGAPIRVCVTESEDGWLVDVSDARPDAPPVPDMNRDPAHGGLGLHLVARLSARYGWTVEGTRKHVWASLGRSRG